MTKFYQSDNQRHLKKTQTHSPIIDLGKLLIYFLTAAEITLWEWSGRLVRLWANAEVGQVLVSTATPPTVGPQHLNIPKGQVFTHRRYFTSNAKITHEEFNVHKID